MTLAKFLNCMRLALWASGLWLRYAVLNPCNFSKMHLWERQRRHRDQPGGAPGSPTAATGGISEASLPPDFRRKYDAWQQLRERQQKVQQSHPLLEGGPPKGQLPPAQQECQACDHLKYELWSKTKVKKLN